MKKFLALTLALVMVLALCACSATVTSTQEGTTVSSSVTAEEQQQAAAAVEEAAADAGKQTYAIITKSAGNPYNEREASGFEEAIKDAGYEVITKHPAEITAEAQIALINELVAQGVDGIAIAANDLDALQTALKAAMDAGIKVVSLDSTVNPASRMTHINQAGVKEVGQALVDAAYDLLGGDGEWAILSATSTASNQNAWIDAMKEILAADSKYDKIKLVDVVYGDDEYQKSVDETLALLQNHPNLKLICAPTTVGIAAASKVVDDEELEGKVIVTGLGLPSEMAEYMEGENPACTYMFLWNPIDVGRVAGYALTEMVNGALTGEVGQTFKAANGTTYTVTEAGDGGTEIIIGPPFKFDGANIGEWKTVY